MGALKHNMEYVAVFESAKLLRRMTEDIKTDTDQSQVSLGITTAAILSRTTLIFLFWSEIVN